MRRFVLFVSTLACSAPAHDVSQTNAAWTARCAAHIDTAKTKLALGGTTKIDATPWHPVVRFESRSGDTYWEAIVSHGQDACIDFDSDDPSFVNLPWTNSRYAPKVSLARIRRMNGDEASLGADHVPRAELEPFRIAFEQALDACLADARTVPIGDVPKDLSCMDKTDRCPDSPTNASVEDGCPSQ